MAQNRNKSFFTTLSTRVGNGPVTETVTEHVVRIGRGCKHCSFTGEILHFYERPGGPPGNQYGPCPECYKGDKPASADVRAALDELKAFDGG